MTNLLLELQDGQLVTPANQPNNTVSDRPEVLGLPHLPYSVFHWPMIQIITSVIRSG